MRLQVLLARAGVASRRKAEELIAAGEVTVNGRVVARLGSKVDPQRDAVKVHGRLLGRPRQSEYYLFHKPVACVTTMSDPQRRFCVGEIVERLGLKVYPVGRLDYHSSGLLLLTNDGELAQRMTHPRYEIAKTYLAKVASLPGPDALARLCRGVRLEDGLAVAARARTTRTTQRKAWIEIVVAEGRTRQVRRMLEAVGLRVEKLRRVQLGPLSLGRLPAGGLRALALSEVGRLRECVGLEKRGSSGKRSG